MSLARSKLKGSISDIQLGTVGGFPMLTSTTAVIPLVYLNSYVAPPRTNISLFLNFSINPSSSIPIIWFPNFTLTPDWLGIVPIFVI